MSSSSSSSSEERPEDEFPKTLTQEEIDGSGFFKILKLLEGIEVASEQPTSIVDDDTSVCSFSNLEHYLDEIILPTVENKKILAEIALLGGWGVTHFDKSFDWNISLLLIFNKICATSYNKIKTWKQFFPMDQKTSLWYTGEINENVNTTPLFTAAMINGLSGYVARMRNEFSISTAMFIVLFNHLFTLKPATEWVEDFRDIQFHITENQGNWDWKRLDMLLHRIATVSAGNLNPYLWYEIMLAKTFGDEARHLCRVFQNIGRARFYTLQAMFDTLFPKTLYVALYPGGYISIVLASWLRYKPACWQTSSWKKIVFYEVEDVSVPEFIEIKSEIVTLFGAVDLNPIDQVVAPVSYQRHLEKLVPNFKKKEVFRKSLVKRTSPSSSSSSSSEYKTKLRRRE